MKILNEIAWSHENVWSVFCYDMTEAYLLINYYMYNGLWIFTFYEREYSSSHDAMCNGHI